MGLLQPHGRGRRLLRRDALSRYPIGSAGVPPACGPEARGPSIVVHTLTHAVAVLTTAAEARRPVMLLSAPDAGIHAGPGWWREVIAAARAAVPAGECTGILDCGDDAGAVQAAIRAGVEAIVFTGRGDVAERLADIAAPRGAWLLRERPAAALDLADEFFADSERMRQRVADVLASRPGFC